jgi:hypothetical protein
MEEFFFKDHCAFRCGKVKKDVDAKVRRPAYFVF